MPSTEATTKALEFKIGADCLLEPDVVGHELPVFMNPPSRDEPKAPN